MQGLSVRARLPKTIDPDIGPVAPQTDLYSMGCILFQMMTDQTPWVGDTDEMLEGHLNGRIRRLSEVIRDANPEMEALVYWLMQKNPKARPASATEVVKALLKIEQKLVASETNIFRLSQAFSDTKRLPAKAKATAIEPAPETSESLGTADTNRWADSTNTNPIGGRSAVTMEVTGESRTEHSVPALHDAGAQKSRALLWVGLGALAVVVVGAVLMLRSGTETPVGDTLPEAAVLGSSDASAPGLEHRPEVAVKPPPPVAAVSDAGAPSKVEGPKPEAVKVETRVVTPPVTPTENTPRPTRVKDPAAPVKLCATNLDAFKAEVLRQRSQPGCMGACADAFDDLADEARPGASLEDLCSKLKALKRAK